MNTTEAIELIIRQLNGPLPEAEALTLARWLEQREANRQTYRNLAHLYNADWSTVTPPPGEDFFEKQRMIVHGQVAASNVHEQRVRLNIKVAATLALILLASLFVYLTLPGRAAATLSFHNAEVTAVADVLEQTYHVHIEVTEQVAHIRFTGVFIQEDFESVLATLSCSMPLTINLYDKTYVFSRKSS